jgi:hypothetical protein
MLFRSKVKTLATLFAFVAIGAAIFASSALATNGHQDHQGACARSTASIKKGVTDLKYNGVLGKFAKATGIHGFDGSLKKQMEEQLVIGTIAVSVTTENTGCNGAGGTFGAGGRTLYNGEKVALRVPAKYGKEACKHPNPKCKKVRVVVSVVFPISCWNKNRKKRIVVYIWVRKTHNGKKHGKHHGKKHGKCSAKGGHVNGNCVKQTNTATVEQECKGQMNGNQCISTITQINANCSNVAVGNSGDVNQGGNCNTGGVETCVGQSNCNVTPPPEEPCGCIPKPTIKITSTTELNMIPAGKTSGDFYIGTYASESGGTLVVDPGIGSVSSCNSSTPKNSVTVSVPSGASEACVILYAPEDGDEPEYMTVTMTACLGSLCVPKTQTFKITYPKRP